jgi:hypothetical protein
MTTFLLEGERLERRFERPSPPRDQPKPERMTERPGLIDLLNACGAILIVGLGLVFVFILSLVALGTVQGDQKATTLAAALGVIGTIVGTYFGHKAGSAGKERAENAREAEAAKVQELTAELQPEPAKAALDRAQEKLAH